MSDQIARYTNPKNYKPEDMVGVGKYIVIARPIVREVATGDKGPSIVLPKSSNQKNDLREIFASILSIGPDVTVKRYDGKPLKVGDVVLYGNSMGFNQSGEEAFWDVKMVHELNILSVMRDIGTNEVTDNLFLRQRLEAESHETKKNGGHVLNEDAPPGE